jgi:putative peptidoglycan lipid II flippase
LRSVASNARLIGAITFGSRVLGLAREAIAAAAFGAGPVWSAFTVAFTIPNLFRKLFGEGALSAAFIPIYGRLHHDSDRQAEAETFARQGLNLLILVLIGIVLVGEAALLGWLWIGVERWDHRLALTLTAIMLPYVVLICGAAFLSGYLNVRERFGAPAAASVVLNVCLIAAIVLTWFGFDLSDDDGRSKATLVIAAAVLVSGVLQVAVLVPGLIACGFTLRWRDGVWSHSTRKMVRLGLPVALSAAVLQVGVLLDKGIAFFLAADVGGELAGLTPMLAGAAARLNWAQFLYQFPLGVFAIALATAIFPRLSKEATIGDGRSDAFRQTLRRGVEQALYIGLPASAGLMLVSTDAVRVLFERGRFTPDDTRLVAMSVTIYAAAIWAFGLQQILNRAFYALHETRLPLIWAGINLAINLAIELPLIWLLPCGYGEVGMPVGTLASFAIQSLVMLWLLDRRVGGMGLSRSVRPVLVMLLGTGVMVGVCLPVQWLGEADLVGSVGRLVGTMGLGAGVYFGIVSVLPSTRPTD